MHRDLLSLPFLLLLAPSLRAQAPLHDLGGLSGDTLGTALAPIGDLDGDGLGDLILGGAFGDGVQPAAGRVVVVSGMTGATLLVLLGQNTGDRFGYSVCSRPDVNNDGKDDIVVGVTGYDGAAGSNTGRVETYASDGSGLITFLEGPRAGDQYGWCVRRLGDCNGDGADDFAMGAPYHNSAVSSDIGRVVVFSGQGLTTLDSEYGTSAGDLFGYSVDFVGDLDNDGYGDLVVGLPGTPSGGSLDSGTLRLVSTHPFASTFWSTSSLFFKEMGFSVAGLADVDGDGVRDFAGGEPGAGLGSGRVAVYSGASKALLREFQGSSGERLGFTLASAGDFDGDGRGDLIAGAPFFDNGGAVDSGRALVLSAQSGAVLAALGGTGSLGQMGLSVSSAGDLNLDGADEVMAGAPFEDLGYPDAGHVRVILGAVPAPTSYCTAKVNSAGCTPFITSTGCASVSVGAGLTVIGANVLPGMPGLMIWSKNANSLPFFGGTLCVGSPLFRVGAQVAGNNPLYPCTGQYTFLVNAGFLAANGLTPGTDVRAQFWSRDQGFAAPNNVGLTNGLEFQVAP